MEEIHAFAALGALDLFLEVVVDAEALQVVDGGHRYRLPAAPSTSIKMKSLPYTRDAFLVCQWWRVSTRLLYVSKSNDGATLSLFLL